MFLLLGWLERVLRYTMRLEYVWYSDYTMSREFKASLGLGMMMSATNADSSEVTIRTILPTRIPLGQQRLNVWLWDVDLQIHQSTVHHRNMQSAHFFNSMITITPVIFFVLYQYVETQKCFEVYTWFVPGTLGSSRTVITVLSHCVYRILKLLRVYTRGT